MLAAPYAYGAGFGYGAYPAAGYGYGLGAYGGLGYFNQQHGQQRHPGMTNLMMQPGLQQDSFGSWIKGAAKKVGGAMKKAVPAVDKVMHGKAGGIICGVAGAVNGLAGTACNAGRTGIHIANSALHKKHLQQM